MKPSIVFKGIVKGAYSFYQRWDEEIVPVYRFEGNSIDEVLNGLAIEEFTFILKVNGRRIKDVFAYIKRQGLDIKNYTRQPEGEEAA